MRGKEYSKDLRIRVINHIKSGKTQTSASLIFKVSKSAVNRWWLRYVKDKDLTAKKRGGSKGKVDVEELQKYVELNPDKTLKEIGIKFSVSDTAIGKRLKKMNFSYKKKRLPTKKPMNRKEKNTSKD